MSLLVRRLIILAAGATAGLLAWGPGELLLGVQNDFPSYLLFTITSGAIYGAAFGLAFGTVDGITGGVTARKWLGLATGVAVGLVAGAAGAIAGQAIFLATGQYLLQSGDSQHGFGLALVRGISWSVMGAIIGLGEGLRFRSWKRAGIGALGGFLGGIIGGLIVEFGSIAIGGAWWTRPAGAVLLGLALGFGFALIERGFLLGTLVLVTGPLRGREYPVPPGRTTIGRSVSDTISLLPYGGVEERHAVIRGGRAGMTIESEHEMRVNEQPVDRTELKYDDVIDLGKARFFLKTP